MGEEKEKFEVNSLSSADWALRKIKELEADIKQNMDFAESEKIRLEQWLESENNKYKESIEYFNS
ncbi:MAG: host-nuclease inhibitor Gam family protein [Pseudolactococcus laudensis]